MYVLNAIYVKRLIDGFIGYFFFGISYIYNFSIQ